MLTTNWPTRSKCRETVNANSRRGKCKPSKRVQAERLAARTVREGDPNGTRAQIATAVFKRAKRDDLVAQREAEIAAKPVVYPLTAMPVKPVRETPDAIDLRYQPAHVQATRKIDALVNPRPVPHGWRDLKPAKPSPADTKRYWRDLTRK